MSWCCIQLGSREHYAIPAALHGEGKLDVLFTDTWLRRGASCTLKPWFPSFAGRRRDGIPDSLVRSRTLGRLWKEVEIRRRNEGVWEGIMRRNEWFGAWVAREMENTRSETVFSFAHTARQSFKVASRLGLWKVLDQMDGSWREEELWRELSAPYHDLEIETDKAPKVYRDLWREELTLADVIVVNSEWSKKLVIESGADAKKTVVLPLVYETSGSVEFRVKSIEGERRLSALFLGTVCLRKGAGQLFDVIRQLVAEPIDFIFAGPVTVKLPEDISSMSNVRFMGAVDRATADRLYAESDVFLFPTLSDGFGLTQLEALGHGVPVIASTHCGSVVETGVNGLVLSEITPEAIAEAIMTLVRDRDLLAQLKANARVPDKFHPRHLGPALLALEKKSPVSIAPEVYRE